MNLSHAASELSQRITQGPTLAFLILMLALLLGPKLAEKVRLPAMVGLVLAGMVLGPFGSRLLDSKKIALSALGTFGLLYLMFAAGLELTPNAPCGTKLAITSAGSPSQFLCSDHERQCLHMRDRSGDGLQLGIAHAGDLSHAAQDGTCP